MSNETAISQLEFIMSEMNINFENHEIDNYKNLILNKHAKTVTNVVDRMTSVTKERDSYRKKLEETNDE